MKKLAISELVEQQTNPHIRMLGLAMPSIESVLSLGPDWTGSPLDVLLIEAYTKDERINALCFGQDWLTDDEIQSVKAALAKKMEAKPRAAYSLRSVIRGLATETSNDNAFDVLVEAVRELA